MDNGTLRRWVKDLEVTQSQDPLQLEAPEKGKRFTKDEHLLYCYLLENKRERLAFIAPGVMNQIRWKVFTNRYIAIARNAKTNAVRNQTRQPCLFLRSLDQLKEHFKTV